MFVENISNKMNLVFWLSLLLRVCEYLCTAAPAYSRSHTQFHVVPISISVQFTEGLDLNDVVYSIQMNCSLESTNKNHILLNHLTNVHQSKPDETHGDSTAIFPKSLLHCSDYHLV